MVSDRSGLLLRKHKLETCVSSLVWYNKLVQLGNFRAGFKHEGKTPHGKILELLFRDTLKTWF